MMARILEKIPAKGCFVMVRGEIIPVEFPIDPLSIFYAFPVKKTFQEAGKYFGETVIREEIYAKVKTEFGECLLKEHEYSIVKDQTLSEYFEYCNTEHAKLNFFGNTRVTSKKFEQALFYVQQRGISRSKAVQLCIGLVNSPNVFWITMHEEYQRLYTRYYDSYIERKNEYLKKLKSA